jgi:hypothetical protein
MIDENLRRAELDPAQRAKQTAQRKAIYEELHPEAAHGANQHTRRSGQDVQSFAFATSEAVGRDARTVRRDAERGEKIDPEVLADPIYIFADVRRRSLLFTLDFKNIVSNIVETQITPCWPATYSTPRSHAANDSSSWSASAVRSQLRSGHRTRGDVGPSSTSGFKRSRRSQRQVSATSARSAVAAARQVPPFDGPLSNGRSRPIAAIRFSRFFGVR